MSLISSNTTSDMPTQAEAVHQLSDISRRLSRDLAGLNTHRKYIKAATSSIRQCLNRLRAMSHVPTTAIRKSQVNMALRDVAESLNLDEPLRQEAEAIHGHFSQHLLADSLVHWSPDEPFVIVLLPISDRSFPIGIPATSPPTISEDRQPSFFLLRFDLDNAQAISLNQHALHPRATPSATTSRISAVQIPSNTHLNASALWSLSNHVPHGQHLRHNLAVQTAISPSAANTTTAVSITVDVVAATQQQPTDTTPERASFLCARILPRRVCPARTPRSPLLLLDADPAQRVVQVDAVFAGSDGERFVGGRIEEVRLMERRAVWGDGEGSRARPAADVGALLSWEEGAGRRCSEMEGMLLDVVLVLVVFGFMVVGRWMRRGWGASTGQRRSCWLDEKRMRGGDEERGLLRDEKSGQV